MVEVMSMKTWITIITLVLLGVVVYFGWPEIVHAWQILDTVNLWVLSLLIPVQLFSYWAVGRAIFSYLRSKGDLKGVNSWAISRMALELNFVNHILPSGGAAGFSYLGWVLGKYDVSAGRAAMAQIIRYVMMFSSFVAMLCLAVVVLTLDNNINRVALLTSGALVVGAVSATIFAAYLFGGKSRLVKFAIWLTDFVNKVVSKITRGKKTNILRLEKVEKLFEELHDDYLEIRRDRKLLNKPFMWSVTANIADVMMLMVAFIALGVWINPATLFVAFGMAGILGFLSSSPGGAGVYEAIMVTFLVSSGIPIDIAIAGTILARVALLLGTLISGYVFYQLTINKYGKKPV